MSTRDLIDAIDAGDSTKFETSFNDIMAAKVSDKLDAMRDDMAQNMFKGVPETEDNNFDPETEVSTEEPEAVVEPETVATEEPAVEENE